MQNKNAALNDSLAVLFLLIVALAIMISLPIFPGGIAAFYDNTTVITKLNVSNAAPTVDVTVIYDNDSIIAGDIILNAGTTETVWCNASARDTNGFSDINKGNGTIFLQGHWGEAADRDFVYTNDSCSITPVAGDPNNATISCSFQVFFHADNGTWNCSIYVWDNSSVEASDFADASELETVAALFALELNTTEIDYGVLNVTDISEEQTVDIKNTGNMDINISVDGYGAEDGDGVAMNCSESTSIDLSYERYAIFPDANFSVNMTQLTDDPLPNGIGNLTVFETDDDNQNSTNLTYWRIEVPIGVEKGPCNGTIIFSAVG